MLKMVVQQLSDGGIGSDGAGTPVRHKSTRHVETSNATGSFVREHNEFFCRNAIRFVWARCVASSRYRGVLDRYCIALLSDVSYLRV